MSASLVGSEMCIRDRARIYGPLGLHLESLCEHLAPQGFTWVFDETKDHFAQAADFDFAFIRGTN
eukprot:15403279-Alexandrium_andersonii.AAC.1